MAKTSPQEIVVAACELFRTRGYAGTSMKDLADKVGIQKASLYNYVSSKEDLVARVLDLTYSEIFVSDVEEGDWRAAYGAAVARLASHLMQKRRCVALHLGYGVGEDVSAANEAVKRFFMDCREKFATFLVRGMPSETAYDLATDTITLLEGGTTWLATTGDDGPMRRAVAELLARADAASNEVTTSKVKSILDDVVGDFAKATLAEKVLAERLVQAEQRVTLLNAPSKK